MNAMFSIFAAMTLALVAAVASPWLPVEPKTTDGSYDVKAWKLDWPGCKFEDGVKEGRLSIVQQGKELWWRVAYAAGQIGPTKGGAGWRWPFSTSAKQSVELRYRLLFEDGFEFVKGGKLPGLCGGPKTITGGEPCSGFDGWSVRLMWRKDGRGQAYVYHPNMKSEYGDEFDFPDDFRFPTGSPVEIRIAIEVNSIGKRDGSLYVWVTLPGQAERLVVEQAELEWTKDASIGVDSILFNTFFGGSNDSWAPSTPCAARFGKIEYCVKK